MTDIKRTGYSWRKLEKKAQDRKLEDHCEQPMTQEGRRMKKKG